MVSYTDGLIGATVIDLENRLYANTLFMNRRALVIETKKNKLAKTKKYKKGEKKPSKKELADKNTEVRNAMRKIATLD